MILVLQDLMHSKLSGFTEYYTALISIIHTTKHDDHFTPSFNSTLYRRQTFFSPTQSQLSCQLESDDIYRRCSEISHKIRHANEEKKLLREQIERLASTLRTFQTDCTQITREHTTRFESINRQIQVYMEDLRQKLDQDGEGWRKKIGFYLHRNRKLPAGSLRERAKRCDRRSSWDVLTFLGYGNNMKPRARGLHMMSTKRGGEKATRWTIVG